MREDQYDASPPPVNGLLSTLRRRLFPIQADLGLPNMLQPKGYSIVIIIMFLGMFILFHSYSFTLIIISTIFVIVISLIVTLYVLVSDFRFQFNKSTRQWELP